MFDPTRIPKLLADVTSLGQAAAADGQIVQSMAQLGKTIGNTTAMATSVIQQLSAIPSSISGEVMASQSSFPTNPVAALDSLEQAMFETGAAGQTAAQIATRSASRAAAAQQEQVGAFATGLMKSSSLPSVSSLHSQLATTALGSDQLHADFAANSSVRLAFYQDVGGVHQLTAAWLSQRAAGSALKHPTTGGGTVPQPVAATSGTNSQRTSSTQTLKSTVEALVSLHDSRVAAQALLTTYPSLQQTIARSALANQFTSTTESALQKWLSSLGAGSGAILSDVETALQTSDSTGWLDSGKDAQARQAAARVLAALAAGGMLSPGHSADDIQQTMSAWLDANKQSQYWAQLAQSAQNSITGLDDRLGALSDRVGLDVAGNSAAAAESALLNRLRQDPSAAQWQGLIIAAIQDPGAQSVLKIAVPR